MNGGDVVVTESQYIRRHHQRHQLSDNQCTSALVKHVKAPVNLVWSLVRRFDQPQKYKPFVSRCVVNGELGIGSVREVNVKSGLPATTSRERLELLNDEEHILGIKIVGGDHRLKNYSSIITVHPEIIDGSQGTLVIESFAVDVPEGNTKDETCYFVNALIKCNLQSLADVSERMARLIGALPDMLGRYCKTDARFYILETIPHFNMEERSFSSSSLLKD
ncbi:hypothetical protein ACFE04_018813 [Oxalis oulophora]